MTIERLGTGLYKVSVMGLSFCVSLKEAAL